MQLETVEFHFVEPSKICNIASQFKIHICILYKIFVSLFEQIFIEWKKVWQRQNTKVYQQRKQQQICSRWWLWKKKGNYFAKFPFIQFRIALFPLFPSILTSPILYCIWQQQENAGTMIIAPCKKQMIPFAMMIMIVFVNNITILERITDTLNCFLISTQGVLSEITSHEVISFGFVDWVPALSLSVSIPLARIRLFVWHTLSVQYNTYAVCSIQYDAQCTYCKLAVFGCIIFFFNFFKGSMTFYMLFWIYPRLTGIPCEPTISLLIRPTIWLPAHGPVK